MSNLFFFFPIIFFFVFFLIFVTSIASAIKANQNYNKTRQTVNNVIETVQKNQTSSTQYQDHNETHFEQQNYTYEYAKKNKSSHDIKDKPLTEAEKNVLYGK